MLIYILSDCKTMQQSTATYPYHCLGDQARTLAEPFELAPVSCQESKPATILSENPNENAWNIMQLCCTL